MKRSRLVFLAWSVMWCCGASAVPSKYVKQQAVKAADQVMAAGQNALGRYEQLKAGGKLDELEDRETPRALTPARQLRRAWDDGYDAYLAALGEGWTPDDPDLTKARETLEAARARFEACGMWVAVRFGEPAIPGNYRNRLEVIRDQAYVASVLLANKQVDDATYLLEDADKRFAAIQREAAKAKEDGDNEVIAPDHPALQRTAEEIARLKALGAGTVADTAKLREAVDQDVEALLAAREKYARIFQLADEGMNAGGTEEQRKAHYEQLLVLYQTWFKEQKEPLEKLLAEFGAKYGTALQPIQDKLAELKGGPVNYAYTPGHAYEQLVKGITTMSEHAKALAQRLFEEATGTLAKIDDYSEDLRVALYDREKARMESALAFDPENADIKARLARIDAEKAAKAAEIEKLIDARVWPPHVKSFAGPGQPDELAASALAFLKAHAEPGERPVAVRVTGNWEVGEKDVFGRPINYQLPILMACLRQVDQGKDLARVFELSMITLNLKQAPPWKTSATLGSWHMRASKLPQ